MKLKKVPWMTEEEIKAITNILKERTSDSSSVSVLEWGMGGSTFYWPSMYPSLSWTSVEHNKDFFDLCVRKQLPDNVKPLYRKRDKGYTDINGIYDVILIDGRDRVKCAKSIKKKSLLNDSGIVLLHDAFRKRYRAVYDVFDRFKVLYEPEHIRGTGLVLFTCS